jgi:hypothetical protein
MLSTLNSIAGYGGFLGAIIALLALLRIKKRDEVVDIRATWRDTALLVIPADETVRQAIVIAAKTHECVTLATCEKRERDMLERIEDVAAKTNTLIGKFSEFEKNVSFDMETNRNLLMTIQRTLDRKN